MSASRWSVRERHRLLLAGCCGCDPNFRNRPKPAVSQRPRESANYATEPEGVSEFQAASTSALAITWTRLSSDIRKQCANSMGYINWYCLRGGESINLNRGNVQEGCSPRPSFGNDEMAGAGTIPPGASFSPHSTTTVRNLRISSRTWRPATPANCIETVAVWPA